MNREKDENYEQTQETEEPVKAGEDEYYDDEEYDFRDEGVVWTERLRDWIGRHIKGVSVLICAVGVFLVGGVIYVLTVDEAPADKVQASAEAVVKKTSAPVISVYSDKIYAGIGQEVSVQKEVVRSVESYGEPAEVSIECTAGGAEVTEGSGDAVNGVPDIRIIFSEAGEYDFLITAEAEETTEATVHVTVIGKLVSYVTGIRDLETEEGAKDIDCMEGISWDKEYVKEVSVDKKDVDLSKAGDYKIVYTILPAGEGQKSETVEAVVHVIKKEETKPEEEEKEDEPEKEDKPEAHTHKWQKKTETIRHPEESHIDYVLHPAEKHMETVTTEAEGHYETRIVYVCNTCGQTSSGEGAANAHSAQHEANGESGGWSKHEEPEWVVDVPASTDTIEVVDKEAWTEEVKVVDKEAWTETKTYYVCSCGERK